MSEELEEDESYNEDDYAADDYTNPQSDHDRIELLRIALNFPERPDTGVRSPLTIADLEELESILKKHYRH